MSCPVSKVLDYSFIHIHIHDFTDRFMNLGIVLLQWWKYMIDWGKKKKKEKKKKKVLLLLKFHVIECIKRKKRKNKHLDSESPLHTHRF